MIMVNLAHLCNDRNQLSYKIEDLVKDFCDKYQMHPSDLELKYHEYSGKVQITIKV